jgi:predicted nucleic-acid-binding Zn-ribbon protein
MSDINNIESIKKKLEDAGKIAVENLVLDKNITTNDDLLNKLSNIMDTGNKEFIEKTGRNMTYSEMREIYG